MLLQGLLALVCLAIGTGAGYFVARRQHPKLLKVSTGDVSTGDAAIAQALPDPVVGQVSSDNDQVQVAEQSKRIEKTPDDLPSATESPNKAAEPVAAAAVEPREAGEQPQPGLTGASREIVDPPEQPQQQPLPAARTDALTLLLNRHAFDGELSILLNKPHTGASSGVLMMLDIDHLEHVNDQFGKLLGDKALQHVARALRNALLGLDVETARYGGDEIAAFLPNMSLASAKALADELRAAVEQSCIQNDAESVAITISIGLADADAGLKHGQLVARAMQAMYAAKAAGCNRGFVYNGRECASLDESAAPCPAKAEAATAQPSTPTPASPQAPPAVAEKGPEQRAHRRQKFGGMHCIAPYLNGHVPTPDMFYAARFSDLSSGGFSMLLPEPPDCRSFVVALSKGNGTIYVTAEVVRTRESAESGVRLFIVGCRFTGRIEVDCMSREAQAV